MVTMSRRNWLLTAIPAAARPKARLTRVELLPVRATDRTVWLVVRLHSDAGVHGLGEASDAFGFLATTREDAAAMKRALETLFASVAGRSPFDIEVFRQQAPVDTGLVARTAYSAIEQAMWDLSARLLDVPVYTLLGGKVRDRLPVYANINRASRPRTPDGFAATARRAVADGFRYVKLAPFDGFPNDARQAPAFVDAAIAALFAVREAVGPAIGMMVDCHSFFSVDLAIDIARRLEPLQLAWYEEPVAPEKIDETVAIRQAIRQKMAGGEILFRTAGFEGLCRRRAVDVIMPDVKHCGGLLEMTRIAAFAGAYGVKVAPHNPSGPVSTAASVQICAGMENFEILELLWSEVDWRGKLVKPAERFVDGYVHVPDAPGFGITLDELVMRSAPAL
jgi:galactonate dehydratase